MTRSGWRNSSGGSTQGHREGSGPGLRALSVLFPWSRQFLLAELKLTSSQLPQQAWLHLLWSTLNFQHSIVPACHSPSCLSPVASVFKSASHQKGFLAWHFPHCPSLDTDNRSTAPSECVARTRKNNPDLVLQKTIQ